MAITVEEKYKGRSLANESAEIIYVARGASPFVPSDPDPELDPQEQQDLWDQEEAEHNQNIDVHVRDAVEDVAPATHDGKYLDDIRVEEVAEETWYVTAVYAGNEFSVVGNSSFAFEIGGATQHITQSLATVNSYAAGGGTAPDFKGAINVSGGEVKGVDIHLPTYSFSERHIKSADDVDTAYKATLFSLVAKTNNAAFKGLAAGECLLVAVHGSTNADGNWDIEFRFAGSANKTGLSVGAITGIEKKGWEYLWVLYEDKEDTTAKKLVKQPIAAYVEKVYDEGNFALLEIGT